MAELSDRFVASARQGEHSDDLTRGLILMVRPSSAKGQPLRRSWVLRFSRGGKRQRIGLGAYPTVGLAAARQKARAALRDIDEGKDPSRAGKARLRADMEASVLTFGRAVDLYLSKVAQPFKNAKNDHARERGLRVICAPLHPRPVERITPLDIAVILRSLPPGTARKTQSALHALFAYAMVEMAHRGVHFLNPVSADLLKAVGYSPRRSPRPPSGARLPANARVHARPRCDRHARCALSPIHRSDGLALRCRSPYALRPDRLRGACLALSSRANEGLPSSRGRLHRSTR